MQRQAAREAAPVHQAQADAFQKHVSLRSDIDVQLRQLSFAAAQFEGVVNGSADATLRILGSSSGEPSQASADNQRIRIMRLEDAIAMQEAQVAALQQQITKRKERAAQSIEDTRRKQEAVKAHLRSKDTETDLRTLHQLEDTIRALEDRILKACVVFDKKRDESRQTVAAREVERQKALDDAQKEFQRARKRLADAEAEERRASESAEDDDDVKLPEEWEALISQHDTDGNLVEQLEVTRKDLEEEIEHKRIRIEHLLEVNEARMAELAELEKKSPRSRLKSDFSASVMTAGTILRIMQLLKAALINVHDDLAEIQQTTEAIRAERQTAEDDEEWQVAALSFALRRVVEVIDTPYDRSVAAAHEMISRLRYLVLLFDLADSPQEIFEYVVSKNAYEEQVPLLFEVGMVCNDTIEHGKKYRELMKRRRQQAAKQKTQSRVFDMSRYRLSPREDSPSVSAHGVHDASLTSDNDEASSPHLPGGDDTAVFVERPTAATAAAEETPSPAATSPARSQPQHVEEEHEDQQNQQGQQRQQQQQQQQRGGNRQRRNNNRRR